MLLAQSSGETLLDVFSPLITLPDFLAAGGGCGQRGALSKRLWSMRSIVQQARQTHGTVSAAPRPFFFFLIPFKFFVVVGAGEVVRQRGALSTIRPAQTTSKNY